MKTLPLVLVCVLAAVAGAYPDKDLIRREVRIRMPKFHACYEKALAKNPALEGTVIAKFTIETDGSVGASTATGLPGVDTCVAGVIKTIKFQPTTKQMVINYPFAFRPS